MDRVPSHVSVIARSHSNVVYHHPEHVGRSSGTERTEETGPGFRRKRFRPRGGGSLGVYGDFRRRDVFVRRSDPGDPGCPKGKGGSRGSYLGSFKSPDLPSTKGDNRGLSELL